jgi:hypothetical protein
MHCTYRYSNAGDLLNRGLRYSIESRTSLPVQPKKQRQIRRMSNEVRHFPARLMTPDEQALVAGWLATAGDIALAYISKRCNDDPSLHRGIVIKAGKDDAPSHIVYAASGRDIWFVFEPGRRTKIRRFPTLRAALNSIRPVLAEAGGGARGKFAKHQRYLSSQWTGTPARTARRMLWRGIFVRPPDTSLSHPLILDGVTKESAPA